jgi:methylated-DNA-[protein]-cysteine S-methyltransferase
VKVKAGDPSGAGKGDLAGRVYAMVRKVPAGRVTTYGRVAAAVGCRSARAVGQALRRNPHAPEVPCHRVVQSDGRLGAFFGDGGRAAEKMALLMAEGVRFSGGRLAPGQAFWEFGGGRA